MSTVVPRTCTELRDEGAARRWRCPHASWRQRRPLASSAQRPPLCCSATQGRARRPSSTRSGKALGDGRAVAHCTELHHSGSWLASGVVRPGPLHRRPRRDPSGQGRLARSVGRDPAIGSIGSNHRASVSRAARRTGSGTAIGRASRAVSPDSRIVVLKLDPLTEESARQLLETRHSVSDGRAFIAEGAPVWASGRCCVIR